MNMICILFWQPFNLTVMDVVCFFFASYDHDSVTMFRISKVLLHRFITFRGRLFMAA